MVLNRLLKYGIGFFCILFVMSCICLYEHRAFLSTYFSDSLSSVVGIGLYILIFAVAIGMLIKGIFR